MKIWINFGNYLQQWIQAHVNITQETKIILLEKNRKNNLTIKSSWPSLPELFILTISGTYEEST